MARPKKTDAPDLGEAQDLTAGLIERLTCPAGKLQVFLRDAKAPGLRVRATPASGKNPDGIKAFVFEAKLNRQTIRRTIGDVRAWSIDAARAEANRLRVTLDAGTDPREVERQKVEAKASAEAVKLAAAEHTLKNLLTHYCDHLEALGRVAHKDARSIFKLHVTEAWPKIATLPANEVTGEQVADMMRRVLELGKGRTANKLRSYVRAAYQTARAARSKASIPLHFKAYNVTHNPAADTEPDESQNRADKRPLNGDELRQYWQAIKPLPGFKGAVLRLHLLTGGQRIEQLVSLHTSNVSADTITLFDGKGRPGKPARPHAVPLIPLAAAALAECQPQGTYALSTDLNGTRKNGKPRSAKKGDSHLSAITLSAWAVEAAAGIPGFATKRVRSGVETLLASKGIPTEIRGRLQSHGIAGVQARHYDGHDYMTEKRRALEVLFKHLQHRSSPIASNVVPIKAA
ncbi:integrase family protein [Rhodoferax ferrireducens]|uniref:integrase family protein n=1 Tax=Rhodoferax ferrireducens TaxID=192843 RepID=UPI00298E0FCB|nr:integrase family protein [Rhodoferax ferrireducens]WPC65680.1 integrase family protein [Rhodoferax ferrireducens]